METIQIRLPENQIKSIDKEIKKGTYRSRSEAIRDSLQKMYFLSLLDELQETIQKEGINKEEFMKELRIIRKTLYKKYL